MSPAFPQALAVFRDVLSAAGLGFRHFVYECSVAKLYLNLETALPVFLNLPVTLASCMGNYSKL
jgi:hypothetical protein